MSLLRGPNVKKLQAAGDVDGLVQALSGKRGSTRAEAARALGEMGDPSALVHLLGVITRDDATREDESAAIEAIRRIDRTDLLISILKNGEPDARQAAAFAVSKVGGAEAVAPLVKALEDDPVLPHASAGLGRLKDPAALDPLVSYLRERLRRALAERKSEIEQIEELSERFNAVQREVGTEMEKGLAPVWVAITAFGPTGLERLAEALDEETDWFVATAITGILTALGEEKGAELLRARSDRLRGWLLEEEGAPAGASAGPSATIWVETEEEARRLITGIQDPEEAGNILGDTLAKDGSPEAMAFLRALLDETNQKVTLKASGSTNPTRGGVDVTFFLEYE